MFAYIFTSCLPLSCNPVLPPFINWLYLPPLGGLNRQTHGRGKVGRWFRLIVMILRLWSPSSLSAVPNLNLVDDQLQLKQLFYNQRRSSQTALVEMTRHGPKRGRHSPWLCPGKCTCTLRLQFSTKATYAVVFEWNITMWHHGSCKLWTRYKHMMQVSSISIQCLIPSGGEGSVW